MDSSKKFLLQEKDIPTAWYNVMADMKNKPRPMLNPANKQPMKAEDLYPLFNKACSDQEFNTTDQWIEIPEEVREMYKIWRPTPLVRARGLEKLLDTPAHIYFKNESVSPVGSHKLNSAIAQAYYCKQEGVTNITTETGAGQWGAALSLAAYFVLKLIFPDRMEEAEKQPEQKPAETPKPTPEPTPAPTPAPVATPTPGVEIDKNQDVGDGYHPGFSEGDNDEWGK